jgi:hypothetical protein
MEIKIMVIKTMAIQERIVGQCYLCNKDLKVFTQEYEVTSLSSRKNGSATKRIPKVEQRTLIQQNFIMIVEQLTFHKVCLSCNAELKGETQIRELIDIL